MPQINTITWFEIPTLDIERAKKFYESVFQINLEKYDSPNMKMYTFPYQNGHMNYGALGCIVYKEGLLPSKDGVTIYFHCKNLDEELSRIEKFGGNILYPKMDIGENGLIASFFDTEGNKLALHTPPAKKLIE